MSGYCPIPSKKSPRRICGIGKRNDRIDENGFVSQCCALAPDLESILRARIRKILFRQHRPEAKSAHACFYVGNWWRSGRHLLNVSSSHFDPYATSASLLSRIETL